MSALRQRHSFAPEEYLAFERASHERHEYLNGEVFAMTGASARHNAVVGNLTGILWQQLRGRPCRLYASGQRVRVEKASFFAYPDVVVLCGEPRFDDDLRETLLNPTLLLEVLSTSTEGYDRGEKAALYRRIESLQEHVLVVQDRPYIEVVRRMPDGSWKLDEAEGLDATIDLPSIGCTLALAEVYDKVDF